MKIFIKTFLAVSFLLAAQNLIAQYESIDTVDKKSEELFVNDKWNELITYGEKALNRGMDFYALRTRLGRAYFEKQNYFKAIQNYEKAVDLSYESPENSYYLYNLYQKTNRNEDKNYVFYSLPAGLKKKYKPLENSFIDNLEAFSGMEFSNDESKNSQTKSLNTYYSEQDFTKNTFYFNIGFNQIPVRWLNVFFDYTYKNYSKEKFIIYQNETLSDEYERMQNQFFNRFDIRVSNGFIISPSGHFIGTSEKVVSFNRDSILSNDPSVLATLSEKETIIDNFILSLQIKKYLPHFEIGAGGSFSYLNERHQSQYRAYINWYPALNARFNSKSDFVLHSQDNIDNLIFTQLFEARFDNKLSAGIFGSIGRINNYNEQNGFIVYDSPDLIKYKFGTEVKYLFTNRFSGRLLYEYQSRERNLISITPTTFTNTVLNYSINVITAGLSYYF